MLWNFSNHFLLFPGYRNNAVGASHSGEGGKDGSNYRATPYDSFFAPSKLGSGCGSAKGGGFLKLKASVLIDLQGTISAKLVLFVLSILEKNIFWEIFRAQLFKASLA